VAYVMDLHHYKCQIVYYLTVRKCEYTYNTSRNDQEILNNLRCIWVDEIGNDKFDNEFDFRRDT